MAYKFYGHETFRVTLQDGTEYGFRCAAQNTRYGFRHVVDVLDGYARPVVHKSHPYYNRTWERFRYESVMLDAIRTMPEDVQQELRAWIDRIARGEREEAERQVQEFKQEFDKLPDGMKDAVRQMPLETEEDADRMQAAVKMYNIITGR
jgi:hypothetical protein